MGTNEESDKTLFGKPIYYNDVHLEGEEAFIKLVKDMDVLSKSSLGEEGCR